MKGLKKAVALLQVLFLLVAMLPVINLSKPVTVDAAVAGITNGGTYTIVSAYNGKAITQTDLSTFYANCVVWNTNAMSDLAKWTLTERGDYYSFTNIVSEKSMKITGNNNGDNCDFNGYDNSDNYKWKLVPITSGTYAGCYYIVSAVKNNDGNEEYVEIEGSDTQDNDGAQVGIWTKASGVEYEPRQIWRIEPATADAIEFTEAMNDQAVDAFKNKYFEYNSNTGYNSIGQGFWSIAEIMEAFLDGYETTGKAVYKEMFEGTFNDFIATNGETWEYNGYNDDLTWAVLDAVRAYLLFGGDRYLDIAIKNYDIMYNRAITYGYNMLRWCEESDKRASTNSCINGPATVAACYLGIATGDESYFDKAKSIYAAQRQYLYVAEGDNAGWVYDSINMSDGSKNTWCSTYNQGTFLGAATMLYQHYGDEMYLNDAKNVMNYTLKALCNNNILRNENTNSGDLSGFRGVLMRYIRRFIVDLNQDQYLSFFKDNTRVAWMNRNSQNLIQSPWHAKTPENVTWDEFAGYNAISLMANVPTYADSIIRDAYSTIEAEDMDYTRGLISENSSGSNSGRSLGGVQNDCYTAYYNVNFGSVGASKVTFRYSKSPETAGAQDRIELRLGSQNGTLIGTAYLNTTNSWSDWQEVTADITKTTGMQNLYLVYKTDAGYVCNLDSFEFSEAITPKDAFSTIEAENSDANEGIVNDTNPGNIGSTNSGDWVRYDYVDFSKTAKSISFKYAVQGSDAGGTVSVYLDSMDNAPICEASLKETAYDNWSTYVTGKFDLTTPVSSGRHTVYLKFTPDSGKTYVANIDAFTFNESTTIEYSTNGDIAVEGYQISTAIGGSRVIGSVEPQINGLNVTKWGLVYGLASANGQNFGITDADMLVGSTNNYIKSYDSTSIGTTDTKFGDSTTATYFVRTMRFGGFTAEAYSAQYKVRAYAVLEDGTYVYSNVCDYSIYSVADKLYQNTLMNTIDAHNYLYDNILKVVDANYKTVDYNWGNVVVK